MNNLNYMQLCKVFYQFAYYAKQYHFYDDVIDKMEQSLEDMNPVKVVRR